MGENDDISRFGKLLRSLGDNPLVAVFLVGVFSGGGSASMLDYFVPARPDPYTGAMGEKERDARISGDAALARAVDAERSERGGEYTRLSERTKRIEEQIADLDRYRNEHRVESAQCVLRMQQIERQIGNHR